MKPDIHERRRREIRKVAARRGIQIAQVGEVFFLYGPGVDIRTADLRYVLPGDLTDVRSQRSASW